MVLTGLALYTFNFLDNHAQINEPKLIDLPLSLLTFIHLDYNLPSQMMPFILCSKTLPGIKTFSVVNPPY